MTSPSILAQLDEGNDCVRVRTPKEFRFEACMAYLSRSPNECLHRVEDGKVYKLVVLQERPFLLEVSPGVDPDSIDIRFPAEATRPPAAIRSAAAKYVWDWFDLDRDLTSFYQLAAHDSTLRGLTDRYFGLRIVGVPNLFEALCWAIMGQQINLAFAYTLKRRFVEAFGVQKLFGGHSYWLFPSPAEIACLSTADITSLQFTTKKSEYLLDVAGRMASGSLSKEMLLDLHDFDLAAKMLTDIRGIGPWTAHYVLMRCLRHPSAFPIEDVGLHNAIKQRLNLDSKPTLAQLRDMAKPWKGWEAYATFYLWRSLEG